MCPDNQVLTPFKINQPSNILENKFSINNNNNRFYKCFLILDKTRVHLLIIGYNIDI